MKRALPTPTHDAGVASPDASGPCDMFSPTVDPPFCQDFLPLSFPTLLCALTQIPGAEARGLSQTGEAFPIGAEPG